MTANPSGASRRTKCRRRRGLGGAGFGLLATVAAVAAWRRSSDSEHAERDKGGVLDAPGVRRLYDRVAPLYDLLVSPYVVIGGRRLAEQAITELRLRSGDTVVDLGTGTGWNLPRLAEAVGPTGRVIGVDISPGMLKRAHRRLERHRIGNAELVEADISSYRPPAGTRAVIASFAVEMLPDYAPVVERLCRDLGGNGRIAVTGLRDPEGWPEWLARLGSALNRPFGVSTAYRGHRPWAAVERHTADTRYAEALGGVVYLAAGTPADGAPTRP